MNSHRTPLLNDLPVRTAKAQLFRGEGALHKLNKDAGDVLEIARSHARIEPKQMADTMGQSHSLILRGLKSEDALSFHRLWDLSDDFWAALIVAVAERRQLATVRTTLDMCDRRTA